MANIPSILIAGIAKESAHWRVQSISMHLRKDRLMHPREAVTHGDGGRGPVVTHPLHPLVLTVEKCIESQQRNCIAPHLVFVQITAVCGRAHVQVNVGDVVRLTRELN
jgi:hypothetical protein